MSDSTIITGQFVRINQTPASVGERLLARLIDYVLLTLYIICSIFMLSLLNIHSYIGNIYYFIIFLLYMPVLCYSLLCEVFYNGQSAGKRLMNIRVVKADGSTPGLSAYLLRWLLYLVDVVFTSGLGLLVMLVNKNNQRLGDLAANTIVIKEKNYRKIQVNLDEFDYLTKDYQPQFLHAADLSLEQVNVIARTLESGNKDRPRHIRQLAAKVRSLLTVNNANLADEQLLQTVIRDYQYYALEDDI
ncbi:RDD family protein [Bacteroides sp.]